MLASIGLAAILACGWLIDGVSEFPGPWALVPVGATVLMILAAACFAKSSPRMEAWILDHKDFGPLVRAWRENGAIPRKAKVLACAGMAGGFVLFFLSVHPKPWLALAVAAAAGNARIGCADLVGRHAVSGIGDDHGSRGFDVDANGAAVAVLDGVA